MFYLHLAIVASLLRPSWCQFHQYFTSSFFIWTFFVQLLCAYNLGLEFFGKRILAQKLLIKCCKIDTWLAKPGMKMIWEWVRLIQNLTNCCFTKKMLQEISTVFLLHLALEVCPSHVFSSWVFLAAEKTTDVYCSSSKWILIYQGVPIYKEYN